MLSRQYFLSAVIYQKCFHYRADCAFRQMKELQNITPALLQWVGDDSEEANFKKHIAVK